MPPSERTAKTRTPPRREAKEEKKPSRKPKSCTLHQTPVPEQNACCYATPNARPLCKILTVIRVQGGPTSRMTGWEKRRREIEGKDARPKPGRKGGGHTSGLPC
ncbi:hypothetical protein LZ30DRAFT_741786 [Colletotrichum cereale]|nr:hypothetical protein LZ30DRAFT_741786 [Colletotrichum cereale]